MLVDWVTKLLPPEFKEVMKLKYEEPFYHGHRQRLRDHFLKEGFKGFASNGVIELLFTPAIPRRDVKEAAWSDSSQIRTPEGIRLRI